jgi:hypothetical protein
MSWSDLGSVLLGLGLAAGLWWVWTRETWP